MIVSAISLVFAALSLFIAMSPDITFAPALRYLVLAIGALAGVVALGYLGVRGYQPLVRIARRMMANRAALSAELVRVSTLIAVVAGRAEQDVAAIRKATPPQWVSNSSVDRTGLAAIREYRQRTERQAQRLVKQARRYAIDVTETTAAMASVKTLGDLLTVARCLGELADRAQVLLLP